MKKIILCILALCFYNIIIAQDYDVRKTRWGMTISEVISSEYPLTPNEQSVQVLKFENVELSNGHKATILYEFRNKQLTEVRYIMYGYDAAFSKGTCKNIIPLIDKVNYTSFVFDALKSKGYNCDMGWYLVNCSNAFPVGYKNCSLDKEIINKMEKAAADVKCERIGLNFENERTDAVFYFNQYQNTYNPNSEYNMPCNSDFYNTYYWLVFTPNSKVEKQIKKSDF